MWEKDWGISLSMDRKINPISRQMSNRNLLHKGDVPGYFAVINKL